jgi:hypothetical protein
VLRTLQSKERDLVSAFDFMTSAQIADVKAGTLSLDVTTAVQAAHDACKNGSYDGVLFPGGKYKLTSGLNWSPFVRGFALGTVVLSTNVGSGNGITISDLYGDASGAHNGRPLTTFSGNFVLTNTNGANAAIGLFIGGATNANYAAYVAIDGMQVLGFNTSVIRYGHNAIISAFYNFWAYTNAGTQISLLAGATNTGENMSFYHCTFSGTPGTQAGPLVDINTSLGMDLHFYGCSADYLTKLNETGNTAANLHVHWNGGHMEGNMSAAIWLENDHGGTWDIISPMVYSPTAGASLLGITQTTNGGTTNFTKAVYVAMAAGASLYHNYGAGTFGTVDYAPAFPSGSTPPTFFCIQNATAVIGRDGLTEEEMQFTGTLTGCTTAPTGVVYVTRIGNQVTLKLPTLSATSNAVSKTITGLPTRFAPATLTRTVCIVSDNGGAAVFGRLTIETSGVLTYTITAGGGAWTNSGTATLTELTVTYNLK